MANRTRAVVRSFWRRTSLVFDPGSPKSGKEMIYSTGGERGLGMMCCLFVNAGAVSSGEVF